MNLQDAARLAKHANMANAKRFAKHVVPEVVRPARIVWNQAIGALFIVLALPAALRAIQAYRDLPTDPKSGVGLAVSCIFFVVMISFGIASFMKARRIAARVNRP